MKGTCLLWVVMAGLLTGCPRLAKQDFHEFVGTGCAEDPAVALIEVTLRTLEMQGWVATFPESTTGLDPATMLQDLQDGLDSNACVESDSTLLLLAAGSGDIEVLGDLRILFAPAGEPYAGGVYDERSGRMFLSWEGLDTEWSRRCTPVDPLGRARPEYMRSGQPHERFTYLGSGGVGGEYALMNDLNTTGLAWAGTGEDTWIHREYTEIEDEVRRTGIANAFSACGPFDLLAIALSSGGDCPSGDVHDLKLVFVLSGLVDESVL